MQYLKVFTDFTEIMEPLSFEEKGRLFCAMLRYAEDGAEEPLEGNERFVWPMAKRTIDREAAVYQEKVNSAQRARGSRWKQSSETRADPMGSEPTPLESENESLESEQAPLVSDKEYDKDYEKEYAYEQEKEEENAKEHAQEYMCPPPGDGPGDGHTHIPAREEIERYCLERKNGIDPNYFYDYYAATGWKVGQNPVRDWRALIRAWEKRDAQQSGAGPLAGTVQAVVDMARQQRQVRQRNTLLNYREEPGHADLDKIAFDIDEL